MPNAFNAIRMLIHFSIGEDDFHDVYSEVLSLTPDYFKFGIGLGLPLQELEKIRRNFVQNIDQPFTEVLLVWLRHRYDVERHGFPTWRRLVEAVDSPAGGNNHALAKAVASHHSKGILMMKSMHGSCMFMEGGFLTGIAHESTVFLFSSRRRSLTCFRHETNH